MFHKLKYLIIGSPLSSGEMGAKRLNKLRALAAFSPDALASVAYANQEIFLGLMLAGTAAVSHCPGNHPSLGHCRIVLCPDHPRLPFRRRIVYCGAREPGNAARAGCRWSVTARLCSERSRKPDRWCGSHCFRFS
jgi:hypothetical protein